MTFVLESEHMIPKLILASNSPRRRQLLALTGWSFTVQPVDIDERPLPGEMPSEYVLRLAETKALAAGKYAVPGQVVLAADTTVAEENQIMGKPEDAAEAREMLRRLRGRMHTVYTALGILVMPAVARTPANTDAPGKVENPLIPGTSGASGASLDYRGEPFHLIKDICATRVWMRNYTDEEIEAYIASGDPFDKAGAYAIQSAEFRPAEHIEGCYTCVVGLPVCLVVRALARFGMTPPENVTATCPAHLEMDAPCSAYQAFSQEQSGGS
jgi:nucleoside triphosphate pyrophosphatase